jgi:hypothetical protein
VLCHSFIRCNEINDFLTSLTTFCADVFDIVNLSHAEVEENVIELKKSLSGKKGTDMKDLIKQNNKVIITTPNQATALLKKGLFKNLVCHSIIVDKIDMHIALDLSSDLKEIAEANLNPIFETILTTNLKDEELGSA